MDNTGVYIPVPLGIVYYGYKQFSDTLLLFQEIIRQGDGGLSPRIAATVCRQLSAAETEMRTGMQVARNPIWYRKCALPKEIRSQE